MLSSVLVVIKHRTTKKTKITLTIPNVVFKTCKIIILILIIKKIFVNIKVDTLQRAVVLDIACRRHTGRSIPVDLLVFIMKNSHRKGRPRQARRRYDALLPEDVERGARVKKVKSKVRIKRAWRFNNS